ncbi:LRR receptor-like serine threonine-protein kinase [Seminavis robusta]|uniref:LRR receptor-like serine threonine-protein kinase n=1 Tax=Seminavis robusta TaxID=568900 RepID=A0A9N8EFF1_9STRA|nr:LRR receptor-like serine threonine-protein kinase [Seminavis robusta]|eukprot:Sro1073_g238180.1 LRR receptor-like serine threonine-protein kinase (733) ;mRNA; r:8158-10356
MDNKSTDNNEDPPQEEATLASMEVESTVVDTQVFVDGSSELVLSNLVLDPQSQKEKEVDTCSTDETLNLLEVESSINSSLVDDDTVLVQGTDDLAISKLVNMSSSHQQEVSISALEEPTDSKVVPPELFDDTTDNMEKKTDPAGTTPDVTMEVGIAVAPKYQEQDKKETKVNEAVHVAPVQPPPPPPPPAQPTVLVRMGRSQVEVHPGAYAVAPTGAPDTVSLDLEQAVPREQAVPQDQPALEDGLPVANQVADYSDLPVAALEAGHERQQKKIDVASTVVAALLYMMCLVGVIIVIVLIMRSSGTEEGTNQNSPFELQTMAPSSLPDETLNLSSHELLILQALPNYTLEELSETDASLSLAYEWLVQDLEHNNYTLTSRLKQRFALAALFHAMNGEDWLVNDHWLNHSVHECFWFSQSEFLDYPDPMAHVEVMHPNPCEMPPEQINGSRGVDIQHGPYQHIWLHSNTLGGSIPPGLYWLTDLRSISLYNNQDLGGTISSRIGKLSKLEAFQMGGTMLSGTLPTELGLLSDSIFSIAVVGGQLEGPLPSELGLLDRLHVLVLDGNKLAGSVPPELGDASHLKWLYLSKNSFTGSFPVFLTSARLEQLLLEWNQFSGTLPTEIGQFSDMGRLVVRGNHFTGTIPTEFGQLSGLSYFNAEANGLTGSIPTEVGQIASLWIFEPSSNALTGTIPAELEQIHPLLSLDLRENLLSGSIPQGLSQDLMYLDLTNNTC